MKDEQYRLMPMLFGLTLVSGLIDAVTFLHFNHVFVANMTGNIVLLGFAFAGAKSISIAGSLVALAAFMIGAAAGGRFGRAHGGNGAQLLSVVTLAKILLVFAAAVVAAFGSSHPFAYAIIALLAVSMGLQNAAVRSLSVPDITTTVITGTLTGIAADSIFARGNNVRWRRRLGSVVVMFAGALLGAVLLFRFGDSVTLGTAALVLVAVSLWAWRLRSATQP
ncbi:MAG TPA: YoaK family protein [Candidatus Acidoferrales bacterium]|nr:YoaK family protein [Candidatus Acidoferrales bacterium]